MARIEAIIAAPPQVVRTEVLEYAVQHRWKLIGDKDAEPLEFRWRSYVNLLSGRQEITVAMDARDVTHTCVVVETGAKYKAVNQQYDWGQGQRFASRLVESLSGSHPEEFRAEEE
jgi:hypothetical protein